MRYLIVFLLLTVMARGVPAHGRILEGSTNVAPDKNIQYSPVHLNQQEKQLLERSLNDIHPRYDPAEKMLSKKLTGYNYHTDAESGNFHEVRGSLLYAVGLLDIGDPQYTQRAFDIIEKTISLQDTSFKSKSCGVWPYYMEEPLATKKAPIDFNWADFNGVSLLDVLLGHESEIPKTLKPKIEHSLLLAARSIQKRNMGPGYTNIALMGTYVTYMTAHLLDIPVMKEYATKRLQNFYNYTIEKGGFSEYNSPTYTIIALNELERMKRHIVNPEAVQIINKMYYTGWLTIARHYHQPSGQWAGPHSRSYNSLVKPSFYGLLKLASDGKIDVGFDEQSSDPKIKHKIPSDLLPYFLNPVYPRTETDLFENSVPIITGTTFLTKAYSLATANRSGLWNQRRPFLAYWGNVQKPCYLQVRFLHDDYDFSSATFYSTQKENQLLAGINFNLLGGDKHISIDRIMDGKFKARDLRLRFEFGKNTPPENLVTPTSDFEPFYILTGNLRFDFQLYYAVFDQLKGYWEKGSDENTSWIDFVIYKGNEREFDMNRIKEVALGFTFGINAESDKQIVKPPVFTIENRLIKAGWNGLQIEIPVQILPLPKNL